MPGKAEVAVALPAAAAPQESYPFVLKKIMDIPPPNILEEGDDELEKEKQCSSEDVDGGGGVASSAGGGSRGAGGGGSGGGGAGASASLTPAIWEKTIPYDGETFHLEYMDLDEFLLENGIPVSLEEEELQRTLASVETKGKPAPKAVAVAPAAPVSAPPTAAEVPAEVPASASPAAPPSDAPSDAEETVTVTMLQPAKIEEEEEEEEEEGQEEEALTEEAPAEVKGKKTDGKGAERNTPSPIDPDAIEVDINFQPDPTDLVLSSVPGGELFNPRKHKFSDEELKPQPMIKKAKKVFVPDEQKDDKYWSRRKKNNLAAKRSRDARRLKENQITVRASFLERENAALRQQVAELRKDCGRCKNVVARYEAKYGPL
ncbi:TEF transcription factor, PAR bZIP family member b isoform X1 [Xiphophorus couchianus]|uniref:TEF transcription factor, PAR bZIP family member b isoform X1 n=1 Tax=Xiphophorus couchianus TaxID=32473 RepID=UPI001016A49C|nr:thyrotroph embryonic factor isoform X1 [Xiphophorus couchianus]